MRFKPVFGAFIGLLDPVSQGALPKTICKTCPLLGIKQGELVKIDGFPVPK